MRPSLVFTQRRKIIYADKCTVHAVLGIIRVRFPFLWDKAIQKINSTFNGLSVFDYQRKNPFLFPEYL